MGITNKSGDRVARAHLQPNSCSTTEGKPNAVHNEDYIVSGFIGPRIIGTYSPTCFICGLGQIMTVEFIPVGFLSKESDMRGDVNSPGHLPMFPQATHDKQS